MINSALPLYASESPAGDITNTNVASAGQLTAPSPPTEPVAPTAPAKPSSPAAPVEPTAAVTAAPKPPADPATTAPPAVTSAPAAAIVSPASGGTAQSNSGVKPSSDGSGTVSSGISISTGNSNSSTSSIQTGNNNSAVSSGSNGNGTAVITGSGNSSGTTAAVSGTGNGAMSLNNEKVSALLDSTHTQDNSAKVNDAVKNSAVTGRNSMTDNVSDAVSLATGDANVTGTAITSVNTNVDGVAIAEFNVADNHTGDIVLDFGKYCTSGCSNLNTAGNMSSGSGSVNSAGVNQNTANNVNQNNGALVGNSLTLSADSGSNTVSRNTGGDAAIQTGDANVSANSLTFANNNILGKVVYAVVNIFGDLIGDIILPQSQVGVTSPQGDKSLKAENISNGSASNNVSGVNGGAANNNSQFNSGSIDNVINATTGTGDNSVSRNTGGDGVISTGEGSVKAQVLNIANSNISSGGTWWLVIINEAGKWVGKLLGAPSGTSNYAGSSGTQFTVDSEGKITAENSGNGSSSANNSMVNQTNKSSVTQNNNAKVQNNLNLSANTGKNTANDNTGGKTSVTTGDAHIIANLVNFVNNNIIGSGRLVVTVVNVFGSWIGDFITPGYVKTGKTDSGGVGGAPQISSSPPVVQPSPSTIAAADGQSKDIVRDVSKIYNSSATSNGSDNSVYPQSTFMGQQNGSTTAVADGSAGLSDGGKNGNKALIAGINNTADPYHYDAAGKKTVNINLAWLIVLLPLMSAMLILSKKLEGKIFRKRMFH